MTTNSRRDVAESEQRRSGPCEDGAVPPGSSRPALAEPARVLLEFAPLERFVRRIAPVPAPGQCGGVHSLLSSAESQAYQRGRAAGAVSSAVADRLAVALGVHPCQIWGERWWESADEEPVCGSCGAPLPWRYTPRDGFCSAPCRARRPVDPQEELRVGELGRPGEASVAVAGEDVSIGMRSGSLDRPGIAATGRGRRAS